MMRQNQRTKPEKKSQIAAAEEAEGEVEVVEAEVDSEVEGEEVVGEVSRVLRRWDLGDLERVRLLVRCFSRFKSGYTKSYGKSHMHEAPTIV